MTRPRRILLASLSAVWVGMVFACGGGGNRTQPPPPPTAEAVAQPAEAPATIPVPPPPKRPGVGDTVTLTDKSGTVPLAKDHAALAEWLQAKDDVAKSVAQTKGIKSVPSGSEAVILGESGGTFTVKVTRGIYMETTGVITADSALEEYNRKVKESNDALAQNAARAKEGQDRLAKEKAEQERLAAEKKAAEAEADELARKKAEDEYDADGLVLLLTTVKGESNEFTSVVTGTVVNRRGRKLRYAQIKFTIYDESNAQVGTALANITDLEAGGRWNFKAVALVPNGKKRKLSELSGY